MKYILVIDNNYYNRIGIQSLLKGISGVRFLNSVTPENLAKSSLIIFSFSLFNDLSSFLCLNARHSSKIICMIDKCESINKNTLPKCMSNIIFIPNNIKISQLYNLVLECFNDRNEQPDLHQDNFCDSCMRSYFSPQQFNILVRVFNGQSVHDIANELMISKSTIYSHKRYVMTRYNLRTKRELYLFWRFISNRVCNNLTTDSSNTIKLTE
ncbi:helix-turn-helix transcriptional regulator [Salmonella enterica subsp. enterica serovar Enteritidis]|nr:helix-turn-helix transcriptional regulator [Salmonella enterica subsp. enterica serovar Enteritidis]